MRTGSVGAPAMTSRDHPDADVRGLAELLTGALGRARRHAEGAALGGLRRRRPRRRRPAARRRTGCGRCSRRRSGWARPGPAACGPACGGVVAAPAGAASADDDGGEGRDGCRRAACGQRGCGRSADMRSGRRRPKRCVAACWTRRSGRWLSRCRRAPGRRRSCSWSLRTRSTGTLTGSSRSWRRRGRWSASCTATCVTGCRLTSPFGRRRAGWTTTRTSPRRGASWTVRGWRW